MQGARHYKVVRCICGPLKRARLAEVHMIKVCVMRYTHEGAPSKAHVIQDVYLYQRYDTCALCAFRYI